MNYKKYTITQASQVKEHWGKLEWKREKVTIVSIDAVAMFPSIKFPVAKKDIQFYTKNLPKLEMIKIKLCLKLIGFGMSSTLLNFQDKYYEYGDEGLETKGLAIGGYESAFLVDLVASYLLEVTNNQFKEVMWRGIYRDDGLLVFKGKKSLYPEGSCSQGSFR